MKPLKTLVETIYGSHLHGTTTPTSDMDYKAVHLPSGENIILQRSELVINDSTISKNADGSNRPDAIDHESYSLYKFAGMIARGDIVALEILFTPDSHIVSQDPQWPALRERAKTLLNSKAAGFVSYAVTEANRYSIKSDRINALDGIIDLFENAILEYGSEERATVVIDQVKEYALEAEHTSFNEDLNHHKKLIPNITCCDRTMHLTCKLSEIHGLYSRTRAKYGYRTAAAQANSGYEWKSLSHAVRLARQAYELITTGSLVFPRPDADELRAIKLGQVPFEKVEEILSETLESITNASSFLPEETSNEAVNSFVLDAYRTQVS